MSQTIAVQAINPGGSSYATNITAAKVIKSVKGTLFRVSVISGGTATDGALVLNDSPVLVTAQTITGITAAAAAVITLSTAGSANPFAVGNPVLVTGAVGMTQINGLLGTVTAIGGASGAWTVTTNINSSAFTAWSSAGTAASFGAGNEIASLAAGTATGPYTYDWPLQYGLLVSAVPTLGSPQYAIAYS